MISKRTGTDMRIATTEGFSFSIALRAPRKPVSYALVAVLILSSLALVPVVIAAFGIARGGVEPYMVLAALMLG